MDQFGVRSGAQVRRDFRFLLTRRVQGKGFGFGISSLGLIRPDLSLPAYAGYVRQDGIAAIYNFFDTVNGGRQYRNRVTRRTARDFRGGRLSYDDHDGTDFVCPPGITLPAAAPGVLSAVRDSWLRGGLTAIVDHGNGLVTQYSHLSAVVVETGQPLLRGQTVGLSGVSGVDMTSFFPWVPPHVHFMVWMRGRPVDPFRPRSEHLSADPLWHGGTPTAAAGPLPSDPPPPTLSDIAVDRQRLEETVATCRDPDIRAVLARAETDASRLALCEDSLHHERFAWPSDPDPDPDTLRPAADAPSVRLSLPLPAGTYVTARPADLPWTRPG